MCIRLANKNFIFDGLLFYQLIEPLFKPQYACRLSEFIFQKKLRLIDKSKRHLIKLSVQIIQSSF